MTYIRLRVYNKIPQDIQTRIYSDAANPPSFTSVSEDNSTAFTAHQASYLAVKTRIGSEYSIETFGSVAVELAHEATFSDSTYVNNVFVISYAKSGGGIVEDGNIEIKQPKTLGHNNIT